MSGYTGRDFGPWYDRAVDARRAPSMTEPAPGPEILEFVAAHPDSATAAEVTVSRALWAVVEAHRAANAHDLPGNAHCGRPGDEQHRALLATLEERRADLRRAEQFSEARGGVVAATKERPWPWPKS